MVFENKFWYWLKDIFLRWFMNFKYLNNDDILFDDLII